MPSAQEITKKAKSNLAVTLSSLPKERRNDMITFYAFCRVIDDLADNGQIPAEKRLQSLQSWHHGIQNGFVKPDALQCAISKLINKYKIDKKPFLDLIDGCASDLEPQRFEQSEDLKQYTYRVACCVGLISIKIFGCTHPNSEKYALSLGHALQITNILRDVREDLDNEGRIYLPLALLKKHHYSEENLNNHVYNVSFLNLMNELANKAEFFYNEALHYLPKEDRKALKAAEAMRKIYYELLKKMKDDHFHVFEHRYSISKFKKIKVLAETWLS